MNSEKNVQVSSVSQHSSKEMLAAVFCPTDKKATMVNKYIKCKYDSNKTILECNKCGHQETEWYNDQPADPCPEIDCNGRMVRVLKNTKMNLSDYTKNDYETFFLQRFLDFCESTDLDKINRRQIATESQFNRNMFEMDDSKGRIRISKTENPNYKQFITEINNGKTIISSDGEPQEYLYFATGWFFDRGSVSFAIKEDVYNFLISKYFGSFKPNEEYLKKLGVVANGS